ncbi:MAG: hypothetical protein K1Y36_04175 [Blastocatellia bacterium]|nr:hypothetical protein [Blastocatellia bacterium]
MKDQPPEVEVLHDSIGARNFRKAGAGRPALQFEQPFATLNSNFSIQKTNRAKKHMAFCFDKAGKTI